MEIKGLEFDFKYELSKFELAYNFSFVRGDNKTLDRPLSYMNPMKQILSLDYSENKMNYKFIKSDICDLKSLRKIFIDYKITHIIHLAAESHVDRSTEDPFIIAKTNIIGTLSLLQAAKEYWADNYKNKLFYH